MMRQAAEVARARIQPAASVPARQLILGVLRRVNDARIEHDANELRLSEGVVVGTELNRECLLDESEGNAQK